MALLLALLLLALTAPAAAAGELVSRAAGPDGAAAADGESTAVAVANGGRYVLFNSRADNLSTGDVDLPDNDRQSTAFVRDMRTHSLVLVARTNRGAAADGIVSATDMTPNGRFVVFSSAAPNLGGPGVYVRDLRRRRTRRVARGDGSGVISDDGRVVVVEIAERLYRVARGRRRLVHAPPGDRRILSFAVSGNGRHVSVAEGPRDGPGVVEVYRGNRVVQRARYDERPQATAVPLSFGGRYLAAMLPVAKPRLTRSSYFDVLRWDVRRRSRLVINRFGCPSGREVLAISGASMSADGGRIAWTGPPGRGRSPEFPWLVYVADVDRCRVLQLAADRREVPEDDSFGAVLSADGRWVGFSSGADNLSSEDDDDVVNAYLTRVP